MSSDSHETAEAGAPAEKTTLVEEGTELRGSVTSRCAVMVKGRIDGDVTAPRMTITSAGSVSGKVKVDELTSEGELAGECDADHVRLSGTVKDGTVLRAKTLEVRAGGEGGVVFGECTLEIGDAPSREAVLGTPSASPSMRPPRPRSVRPPPMDGDTANHGHN